MCPSSFWRIGFLQQPFSLTVLCVFASRSAKISFLSSRLSPVAVASTSDAQQSSHLPFQIGYFYFAESGDCPIFTPNKKMFVVRPICFLTNIVCIGSRRVSSSLVSLFFFLG
ncbi:hypothetical protein AX774_g3719 [Zancudomyces culisetae]|uniref:Uncharacterized protein n=1 Tax=Zancudomyces culisetae TaxID=1213189 RepID=A0A1R1PP85_ZANCU|nr:hypothetical protein AX774_g3719 [Zancudomyces culisetae]|eukprot:OMH82796.1 hypothetical protein AX774_g3719 [Zancudomyces culisetae]